MNISSGHHPPPSHPPVKVGGPLQENLSWYKISMPSHAGFSPEPEIQHPTNITFSIPKEISQIQVTWEPLGNVNFRIIGVMTTNDLLSVRIAWWSGPFDLCIGFE